MVHVLFVPDGQIRSIGEVNELKHDVWLAISLLKTTGDTPIVEVKFETTRFRHVLLKL